MLKEQTSSELQALIGGLPKIANLSLLQAEVKQDGAKQGAEPSAEMLNKIVTTSIEKMSGFQNTQEHLKFYNAEKIKIEVRSDGDGINRTEIAESRPPHLISVNDRVLKDAVKFLRGNGLTDAEIQDVVSEKLVPVLTHELRHMMNAKELEDLGLPWHLSSVEEETICYLDQAKVVGELVEKEIASDPVKHKAHIVPSLDVVNYGVFVASSKGIDAVKSYVRNASIAAIEVTAQTPEQILKNIALSSTATGKLIDFLKTQDSLKAAIGNLSPEQKETLDALYKKLVSSEFFPKYSSIETAQENLANLAKAEEILKDPAKAAKLKEFYSKKLSAGGEFDQIINKILEKGAHEPVRPKLDSEDTVKKDIATVKQSLKDKDDIGVVVYYGSLVRNYDSWKTEYLELAKEVPECSKSALPVIKKYLSEAKHYNTCADFLKVAEAACKILDLDPKKELQEQYSHGIKLGIAGAREDLTDLKKLDPKNDSLSISIDVSLVGFILKDLSAWSASSGIDVSKEIKEITNELSKYKK